MVTAGPRTRRRDEEERIILMKSRDRRAERMSEFVTNMFQYNVTVGITRSEVIVFSPMLAARFCEISHSQHHQLGNQLHWANTTHIDMPKAKNTPRTEHVLHSSCSQAKCLECCWYAFHRKADTKVNMCPIPSLHMPKHSLTCWPVIR